jgi:hypothetical protein
MIIIISSFYALYYVKTAKERKIAENSYAPLKALTDNLKRRLRFEKEYKKTIDAGEELTAEQKQELKEVTKMKVDILNKYVFPSMANITVFLEYCANPLLQEAFDKDIQELLLGFKSTDYDKIQEPYDSTHPEHYDETLNDRSHRENRTVIARFLIAILSWNSRKDPENFRLKLFPIIQRAITFRILEIGREILGNRILESVVTNDFARAGALAEFIGKGIKIKEDTPNRPVKF